MYKVKLFLAIKKEETWINSIQEEGYKLVSVNFCLPIYKFEKLEQKKSFIPYVRLDCREKSMDKTNYENYITLFSDSGWHLIKGSRYGGIQYFQQSRPDVTRELFSDENSKQNMKKRFAKYSLSYSLFFWVYVFIFFNNQNHNLSDLFKLKSWYLTSGLWEMKGELFWKAFIFETLFILLKVVFFYVCLFVGIYYLLRALVNDEKNN